MSGHSKWSKVKHQKAVTDVRKGRVFSKMAKLITIAAKNGGDPEMNPRLRIAIEKAKSVNMPKDKIENAIKKGTGESKEGQLEEITYEAYGPNGTPLIIETITDNKNRTISEIKQAKYSTDITDEKIKAQLKKLFEALNENEDVSEIYSNVNL